MNKIKLGKSLFLLTILSAITSVALSSATDSWGSETFNSQDETENQVRSETNVNNDISRMPNDDKESSETSNDSRLDVTNRELTVGKGKLSIAFTKSKMSVGKFIVHIEGNNPKPSTFDLGIGYTNPDIELYPGNYKINLEFQDNGIEPVEQHDIVLSDDCIGKISAGQHKTCEIEIYEWPKLIVYTHAAAEGTKASDFTIEALGDTPTPSKFPGNEEGTIVQMRYGDWVVIFEPVDGFFATYSESGVPYQYDCFGDLKKDDIHFPYGGTCDVTIDVSKLKVIVKVNGGPTPAASFKYKINTNDVNVNGKEYDGSSQGTEIPIKPGASYTVQPLPYNNYDASKSGECNNGQAELGKVKVCTVTMTYNVEQDTCHTEINEQGKPVKVC